MCEKYLNWVFDKEQNRVCEKYLNWVFDKEKLTLSLII